MALDSTEPKKQITEAAETSAGERRPSTEGGYPAKIEMAVLAALLIFYFVTRLFSAATFYDLAGDQVKYLTLARNFPFHTLYNHDLYVMHPPPVGWSIGVFHLVLPLHAAGIAATLLWAGLTLLVVYRYAKLLNLTISGRVVALLYLTLSGCLLIYETHVSRTAMLLCFTALSFLMFERFLRESSKANLLKAMLVSAMCMFVSEQSIAILPAQFAIWITSKSFDKWKPVCGIWIVAIAAFFLFPAIRLLVFQSHETYPAGIDGFPSDVSPLPWQGIVHPNLLPEMKWHYDSVDRTMSFEPSPIRFYAAGLLAGRMSLFYPWSTVPVLLLVLSAIYFDLKRRDLTALKLVLLSILFLLPIAGGINAWYGLPFVIPLSLLVGRGLIGLPEAGKTDLRVACAVGVVCLLLVPVWLLHPDTKGSRAFQFGHCQPGHNFILSRTTVTPGAKAMRELESIPPDAALMVPIGFGPEAVYLTGRRVIALPFDPAELDELVDEYEISVIVLRDQEFDFTGDADRDRALHREVAVYIAEHPELYPPMKTVAENPPAIYPAMRYHLFRVARRLNAADAQ